MALQLSKSTSPARALGFKPNVAHQHEDKKHAREEDMIGHSARPDWSSRLANLVTRH